MQRTRSHRVKGSLPVEELHMEHLPLRDHLRPQEGHPLRKRGNHMNVDRQFERIVDRHLDNQEEDEQ
jgi:hypothetical protein